MSAYKRRMSVVSSSARRPRLVERYPILDLKEIAESLQDISRFQIDEDTLSRPSQQYVTALYGDIIECFVGISDQHLRAALEAAASAVSNSETETQGDSRLLLALHRHVYRFMRDCGVDDFSIVDIIKPEAARLRRNLSAVIAFAHFREARMRDYAHLVDECKNETGQFQRLEIEHEELQEKIGQLEKYIAESKEKGEELEEHNHKLESDLRELKKIQEHLVYDHDKYKDDKQQQVDKLRSQSELIVSGRRDNDKMRMYVVESPEMLHGINTKLREGVHADRLELEALEKRSRALQVSTESFQQLHQDLQGCLKALEECEAELRNEREATQKLARYQERFEERKQSTRDLDFRISQLRKQIEHSEAKIERVHKQAEIKRQSGEQKMTELRQRHGILVAERSLSAKKMEERQAHIDSTERKISALRGDLEVEMRAIASEVEKLQAHILQYFTSLGNRMQLGQ